MIKIAPVKFSIPKGSLEEATFKLLEESWTKVGEDQELTVYSWMTQIFKLKCYVLKRFQL